MTLVFPLPLEEFADHLAVSSAQWRLTGGARVSRKRGGGSTAVAIGARVWTGPASVREGRGRSRALVSARAQMLLDADATFLLHPSDRDRPIRDPNASIGRGYDLPVIDNVNDNAVQLRLVGLPQGYRLTAGDWIGFEYGVPARRALHRVVEDRRAGRNGIMNLLQVHPRIRPGVVEGTTPVTLYRPAIRARIVPGSLRGDAFEPGMTGAMSFEWEQVL